MKFWFSDLELWGHGGTSCLCCVFEMLVFYSLQVVFYSLELVKYCSLLQLMNVHRHLKEYMPSV